MRSLKVLLEAALAKSEVESDGKDEGVDLPMLEGVATGLGGLLRLLLWS